MIIHNNNTDSITQTKSYRQKKIRFLQLALLSIALFGNQYAFNNPQSLESQITESQITNEGTIANKNGLNITQIEFNLLYSLFQFPNIFAALMMGFLIDKIGVRKSIIGLSFAVMMFQVVVASGFYFQSFGIILFGRVLFGLASGSLFTAQACMVSFWFKGRQLALALGIATTFPEFGNALNSWLSAIIYQNLSQKCNSQTAQIQSCLCKSLSGAFFASVGICFISFISVILLVLIDIRAEKTDKKNHIREVSESSEQEGDIQQVRLKDILKFKRIFWILVVLSMLAVALYEPFLDNVTNLFEIKFCFSTASAGSEVMVTYLIGPLVSAPFGLMVDKIGFRRYWIMLTMIVMLIAHTVLNFYPSCESGDSSFYAKLGLVLLGCGYALYANCILASIPLVVRKKNTGTAFGIIHMVEAIALCIFPMLSGSLISQKIEDSKKIKVYQNFTLFFFIIAIIGVLISFSLFFILPKIKRKLDSVRKPNKIVHRQENSSSSSDQGKQMQLALNKNNRNILGNYSKLTD